jgi:hypothetical protein
MAETPRDELDALWADRLIAPSLQDVLRFVGGPRDPAFFHALSELLAGVPHFRMHSSGLVLVELEPATPIVDVRGVSDSTVSYTLDLRPPSSQLLWPQSEASPAMRGEAQPTGSLSLESELAALVEVELSTDIPNAEPERLVRGDEEPDALQMPIASIVEMPPRSTPRKLRALIGLAAAAAMLAVVWSSAPEPAPAIIPKFEMVAVEPAPKLALEVPTAAPALAPKAEPEKKRPARTIKKRAHESTDLALRRLQEQVQQTPSKPELYAEMGDVYAKVGNKMGAIAAYRRCVALDPDGPQAKRAKKRLDALVASL